MEKLLQAMSRFFRIIIKKQSYINLFYLLSSFPLGIFYFVFLITGLSTGISLLIIWLGIPVLILVGFGWFALARFERSMATILLKEDIPVIKRIQNDDIDPRNNFNRFFYNPFSWKSLLYLFVKFPLGLTTFVILTTFISSSIALMSMPFTYDSVQFFQIGISSFPGMQIFEIDNINKAIIGSLVGIILWPITLHVSSGLKWIHARFAKLMLQEI